MRTAAAFAEWQRRDNRVRTRRFPWLFAVKETRMQASAHALLRGSAPLFYRLLDDMRLGSLAGGTGWLCGDMHLENVGAYRTDDDRLVFDLNDFDAVGIGPLVHDVLRLLTSVLLVGRGFAISGPTILALAGDTLTAYEQGARTGRLPPSGPAIARIVGLAEQSSFARYLDERAPKHRGARRFVRGERYRDLPPPWRARASALLTAYSKALGTKRELELVDAAFRIAGTGSLGCLRIAYVVRSRDDYRLIELKEATGAATSDHVGPARDAERIVTGASRLVSTPPRGMAAVHLYGGFVGRRLEPRQQKLDLRGLDDTAELAPTFTHVGALLGRAHRRGASRKIRRFSAAEAHRLIAIAVDLAGWHEAIHLAHCFLASGR